MFLSALYIFSTASCRSFQAFYDVDRSQTSFFVSLFRRDTIFTDKCEVKHILHIPKIQEQFINYFAINYLFVYKLFAKISKLHRGWLLLIIYCIVKTFIFCFNKYRTHSNNIYAEGLMKIYLRFLWQRL